MKSNKLILGFIALATIFIFSACDADALFLDMGDTPVEYNFTNEWLEDFTVNEELVEHFQMKSIHDGQEASLEVLYVGDQSRIATDTVILFLHGLGSNMNLFWNDVARLANIGHQHRFGVMMFDYRTFGNSTGTNETIETMHTDVESCIQWLFERGLDEDRLLIYGQSLGTLSGSHLAGYSDLLDVKKLVIEAPQTSMDGLLQGATGLSLDAELISDFGYDIPSALEEYNKHILWLHQTGDPVASYEDFKVFWDEYENPLKQSYIMEADGHIPAADLPFDTYEDIMLDFLKVE